MIPGKAILAHTILAHQNFTRTLSAQLTNEKLGKIREKALNRKYRKQGFLNDADRLELNQIRVSLGGPGYHRLGVPGANNI